MFTQMLHQEIEFGGVSRLPSDRDQIIRRPCLHMKARSVSVHAQIDPIGPTFHHAQSKYVRKPPPRVEIGRFED
jgi:hypothetical protein